MKTKIMKSKYFIAGLILGISILGSGAYAAVTGAGTLGSLFEKIGTEYKLMGENITDNSITENQLKNDSVGSSEIKDNSITSNDISNGTIKAVNIDSEEIQKRVSGDCNFGIKTVNKNGVVECADDNDTKLTETIVDNMVSNNGYLKNGVGISGCHASNVGKYSLGSDGILKKCIGNPEDTRTISSGWLEGINYYDSARLRCGEENSLFGVSCPSGYYYTGANCWHDAFEIFEWENSWENSYEEAIYYGQVDIYCKMNAFYSFEIQ